MRRIVSRVIVGPLRAIRREVAEWYRAFLSSLPGEIGCSLRNLLYGYHAKSGVRVLSHVIVYHANGLYIGANSGIAVGCHFNAAGLIHIGKDVRIGPGAVVWSTNHRYSDSTIPVWRQGYENNQVTIEDDVWIGARAIVLPGVTLARGCIVAAGAVVTKSTEPFTVVPGVPARPIGKRTLVSDDIS